MRTSTPRLAGRISQSRAAGSVGYGRSRDRNRRACVSLDADRQGGGVEVSVEEVPRCLSKYLAVSGLGRVDVSSWSLAGLGTPFFLDWRGRATERQREPVGAWAGRLEFASDVTCSNWGIGVPHSSRHKAYVHQIWTRARVQHTASRDMDYAGTIRTECLPAEQSNTTLRHIDSAVQTTSPPYFYMQLC